MKSANKLSGTPRAPQPSRTRNRLALMASAMLLASSLAGCITDQTGTTVTDTETQCVAWRAIYYKAKSDTAATVQQVREHNATGVRLGCWPK